MTALSAFEEITKTNEPLAPYTALKLGGPADYLVQPRSIEELASVVKTCHQESIPFRMMGGGCNILIGDDGVRGAVLRLSEPVFSEIKVDGRQVRAGAGASLSSVISEAARHSLAGLESLIGIRGTLGGALLSNAGERINEISQYVRGVETLDAQGQTHQRSGDEVRFGALLSALEDTNFLMVELDIVRADS